ncbi:serine/threonine-protein kinase mos-like [Watersipora subatra]|uniref:serine/threonine-protein kinase mos-like n=1 Tax=Watersipora subatra TaxID=2589382 RepID=UPI00355BBF94
MNERPVRVTLARKSTSFDSPLLGVIKGVCPVTLPVRRLKRITSSTSPYQKPNFASPNLYSSPSRLYTLLKCYTWREVKGHLGHVIGRGGFGKVYKAHIHGFDLAVKRLRYTMMNKNTIMKSLQSERLAVGLSHRNVVATYHINDQTDPAYIIMEYVGSQTLQHIIDDTSIRQERVKYYGHDVASALEYIHSLNLVHLDVKPSNVLITCYNLAKLGDFGCSQKLHWDDVGDSISPTNRSDITGTVAYRAPELLKGSPPACSADIYAFGILLWQMLSLKHPYLGRDNHMVIFAVVAHGLRPSLSCIESADDDLVTLCQQCWSANALSRPSASNIIKVLENLCAEQDVHIRRLLF